MNNSDALMDRLVSSPACIPQWQLDDVLTAYAEMGFRQFEAFSSWCKSALDPAADPKSYLSQAREYGISITSFHLPPINGKDYEATFKRAVAASRFAQELGAEAVLFKADTRETYIRAGRPYLDAIDAQNIRVTPVLQNHKGQAISTLDDFREVIEGINDLRMKTLLEVGHFHRVGVKWREGYDLLKGSIALVHINEINAAGQSVPYGTGEVDFTGLFSRLAKDEYGGKIVVELELATRDQDPQRTIQCLKDGINHLQQCWPEEWR